MKNEILKPKNSTIINSELLTDVHNSIVYIRNIPVITDADVAALYEVETKRINEAVKNNPDKFPSDYMFSITLDELSDIKTAVSEAVTNAIIHGYENQVHKIHIEASIEAEEFTVSIQDFGVGIEDIEQAMEPMYTTRRDLERSGMGFVFMEAFMDTVQVESKPGEGTKVKMTKKIGRRYERQD